MTLLRCDHLSLAYGDDLVLDRVSLQVEKGDRICLLGRNGSGKTSFLKIIAGEIEADDGSIWRAEGVTAALLSQELPNKDDQTVYQVIAGGLADEGELLMRYHDLAGRLESNADVARLASVQQEIETSQGWSIGHRIEGVLTRLDLPADTPLRDLSGGWLRRVALARAMVSDPDLLLLDEPTNHLDIPMIQWLEKELLSFKGALLFVTHDRTLMQSVANTIVDLDRGQMRTWREDYQTYLRKRDELRAVEQRQNKESDKKLAQEEVWIRQGIKARRTRNEGRVRALEKMRKERRRRKALSVARLEVDAGGRSGKLVKELVGTSFGYGAAPANAPVIAPVIKNLDLTILRGDRIGIIGANGTGKSTLLKLVAGIVEPDSGTIRSGTRLQVAYFDQLREQLDPERSVADNLADGREFVQINDRSIHVRKYLAQFLFTGDRTRMPVKVLSGGERNRLLLARVFSQPMNLLLLDEPTNDLDVETLELLEDLLIEYEGTLLLVTHDRSFLDNVVTSTLVFSGGGLIQEYVGGYSDWLSQGGGFADPSAGASHVDPVLEDKRAARKQARVESRRSKTVSRQREKELEELPETIDQLEGELNDLHGRMGADGFYQGDAEDRQTVIARAGEIEAELKRLYLRWEELD